MLLFIVLPRRIAACVDVVFSLHSKLINTDDARYSIIFIDDNQQQHHLVAIKYLFT